MEASGRGRAGRSCRIEQATGIARAALQWATRRDDLPQGALPCAILVGLRSAIQATHALLAPSSLLPMRRELICTAGRRPVRAAGSLAEQQYTSSRRARTMILPQRPVPTLGPGVLAVALQHR